ncbi:MAG: GtrA family protein [Puniceicoccales bacterium]|jgi:putative flippase GtrA|nr:GtrA family protein [Puniceicoccales bacterium]
MRFAIQHYPVQFSFLKFVVIGVCNTALDAVLFWSMIQIIEISNPIARAVSFVLANLFSYYANSRWSFKSPISRSRYARFFTISLVGAGIAYVIMALGDSAGWHPMLSFLLSVAILPPVSFTMMRIFVFPKNVR